jgi:serine/threonine protein kinase
VYISRSIADPTQTVVIKIYKAAFVRSDNENTLHNERTILNNFQHPGIIKMLDFGDAGKAVNLSNRVNSNLRYIIMENFEAGLLFDRCDVMGKMGEDAGRFFAL